MLVLSSHLSGHAPAAARQWAEACATLVERKKVNGWISLTETNHPAARQGLEQFASLHNWEVWHPEGRGADECAILWNPQRLTLVPGSERSDQLTEAVLHTHRSAPMHATSLQLRAEVDLHRYPHQRQQPFWVSASHLPAHLSIPWSRHVHDEAIRGWHRLRHDELRGRVVLAMDQNESWFLKRVRDAVHETWPHLHSIWEPQLPPRGTFGRRLIDNVLTNMHTFHGRIGPKLDGFDHHPALFSVVV